MVVIMMYEVEIVVDMVNMVCLKLNGDDDGHDSC